MTERDKMISGELYDATDSELGKDRERVKELCFDYNMLRPSDTEK
ncbi:maltose acetyltransferase domain-containing protein [Peptostreptococcus porci]